MSEFHAEGPQATASEGLAQGPYIYVAVREEFELTTIRLTAIDSTNEPPRSPFSSIQLLFRQELFHQCSFEFIRHSI